MKIGRPSIRTDAMVDEILDRLSEGEPLAQICRDAGMPALRTFYDWQEADGDLSARIARARVAGFDMIAQDALLIADTPAEGVIEKLEPNQDGELVVIERRREDMLGHRKLQVDTRLKLLSKWDPKRYGERVAHEVSGPDGAPVSLIAGSMTPEQAAEAYAATIRGNG